MAAAAQVAVFPSESSSSVPILSSKSRVRRTSSITPTNKMTTTAISATQGTSSTIKNINSSSLSMLSNNGNKDAATVSSPGLVSPGNKSNNFEGITALMAACQQGRTEEVEKILKKKVYQLS
jgi:hypothetical protein